MVRRRRTRGPASRLIPAKKHATLDGRVGEGSPKGFRQAKLVPLVSRLRRLEVVVLMLSGKLRDNGAMQPLLDKMLELRDDTKGVPDGSES